MAEWRRSSSNSEKPNWPPRHGRPLQHPAPSHPSIPRWEKEFCASVGITWKKICETKSTMYLFPNVLNWDDSGALENLQNAKFRFWASINGLPCDIPLPDPDLYTNEVDYYAPIDAELIAELDKRPPPPPPVVENISNLPIIPTGWGDAEDPIDNTAQPTGWGDAKLPTPEIHAAAEPYDSGWGIKGESNDACDAFWDHFGNGSWGNSNNGRGRRSGRKRNMGGYSGKSRQQGYNCQTINQWGDNRGSNWRNCPPIRTR